MSHSDDRDLQRPLLGGREEREQDEIELRTIRPGNVNLDFDLPVGTTQGAIDELDQRIDYLELNVSDYGRSLRHLSKMCERNCCLPSSCILQDPTRLVVDPHAFAQGGFANVYQGSLEGVGKVAVKKLRTDVVQQPQLLFREAVIWKHCRHRNIVPFVAATNLQTPSPWLISLWMIHGNVISYLKGNLDVDIRPLIFNVVDGLGYLHDMNIIHGDLKGANILVNENREACLSDFGMSSVYRSTADQQTTITWTNAILGGGSSRWLAPELLFAPHEKPSFASDAYAFGVVLWEILTCRMPYEHLATDQSVMLHVSQGLRPCFRCITDDPGEVGNLIEIMEDLWSTLPQSRPSVNSELRQRFFKSSSSRKVFQVSWLARCTLLSPSVIGVATAYFLGHASQSPTIPLFIVIIFTIIFSIFILRYALLKTFTVLPVFILGPARSGRLDNILITSTHLLSTSSAIFLCSLGTYLRYAELPETWGYEQSFRRSSFVILWITVVLSFISAGYHDIKLGVSLLWITWLRARGKLGKGDSGNEEDQGSGTTRTQLHVSGINQFMSESDIRYIFEASGEVEWVSIHRTGNHCIVQFRNDLDAERILGSGDFLSATRISRRIVRKLNFENDEYVQDTQVESRWQPLWNLPIIIMYMK
ncbi:kinase-like protein, partial [Dendrothele bispora CBS 962.96]